MAGDAIVVVSEIPTPTMPPTAIQYFAATGIPTLAEEGIISAANPNETVKRHLQKRDVLTHID